MPPMPPVSFPPPPPPKSRAGLVIGIVLVVVLVVGLVGYLAYQVNQQQIFSAARNSEQNAASQGINQLQITCFTVRNDTSHLSYSPTSGYSGYAVIYETFGVSNPTRFVMDVTWTLTIDYISVGWVLTSTAPFHVSTGGVAYPAFAFQVTGSQFNSMPANPDFSNFRTTLDQSYAVTGKYDTYSLTQRSTYDSSTNSGAGYLGSSASLPPC